jgi:ABC-type protease/lipase transport system fused ATPase/permease subunit
MRQQVALARAFYGDPGLLVLDEPAAWLDHAGQQALLSSIDQARARGAAVVMITHQPALLRNASRIAVMNGGTIEMVGPADKVMAHLAGKRLVPPAVPAQGAASGMRALSGASGPAAPAAAGALS